MRGRDLRSGKPAPGTTRLGDAARARSAFNVGGGAPPGRQTRPRPAERPGRIMGLTLCVCPDDHGTIVRIGGEIDVFVEEMLGDSLLRIMRAHTARLLLDLSAVTF